MANDSRSALDEWIARHMVTAPDADCAGLFHRYSEEQRFSEAEWLALLITASDIVSRRRAAGENECG